RVARGLEGVDRALEVAPGAVLEADRHGEAARHLAMGLALGGAGTDRGPRDEVREELRGDRIEELRAGRQPECADVEEQAAGEAEAGLHVMGAVEVRIVDEALPADGRPRLLEVHAHDDEELPGEPLADAREPAR